MKTRILSTARLSFPLASALAALFAAQSAQAQTTRYWDNNGDTAGFGDAGGTWTDPTDFQWSTSNAGTAPPEAGITTAINDPLNFGTASDGLGAGAIIVSGTVNAANLTFGSETTGNILIDGGTINLAAASFINVGAGSAVHSISSSITGAGTSLTKNGPGTLTLSGLSDTAANNYAGTTIISAGTLALTQATTANLTGGLTFGSSATAIAAGTLDLSAASATFGGNLVVRGNSPDAHTITIGSGRTLEIKGAVTVGVNDAADTITNLTATGDGTLSVGTSDTATNANMIVGASNRNVIANSANLDMSGLSTFYANLGTGTFRVGFNSANVNPGSSSTVILADDSTIVATNLILASRDGNPVSQQQTLKLGTGTNVIHATDIFLGAGPGTSDGRANGSLIFNDPTDGNLTLRGLAGDDTRANMSVSFNSFGSGTPGFGLFDSKGHTADLRLENLYVAKRNGQGNQPQVQGQFDFDMGTLDVNNLEVGFHQSSTDSGSSVTGNVNLSGGTTTINNTSGPIRLGVKSVINGIFGKGILNISGSADVDVAAAPDGTSILLGDALATSNNVDVNLTGNAIGEVNLTGGTLAVAGDILRGAITPGTSVATLLISGGTLDMGGNDIGTDTAPITLTAESGTLKDVATINGSGGLTKTTAGTLVLSGTNTYTGDTVVNEGVLAVSGNSIANANKLVIAGGKVDLTNTETVNTLFFGGVQQASGNYTSGHLSNNFTGGGTLTVLTGPGGFSAWITGPFAGGATVPFDQQGPNDDPDNDGILNLVEYAIAGQDPTVPNPAVGTFTGSSLSFAKRLDATGLSYAIEESTDLGLADIWAEVTHNPPTSPYVNDATTISYTFTPGTLTKDFFRLEVAQP
jgi:autotransporter-associated beta strand protein